MPNFNRPDFDDVRERPGFRARRAETGLQGGADKTGAFERPAGGGGMKLRFREAGAVEHFEGVERSDA